MCVDCPALSHVVQDLSELHSLTQVHVEVATLWFMPGRCQHDR